MKKINLSFLFVFGNCSLVMISIMVFFFKSNLWTPIHMVAGSLIAMVPNLLAFIVLSVLSSVKKKSELTILKELRRDYNFRFFTPVILFFGVLFLNLAINSSGTWKITFFVLAGFAYVSAFITSFKKLSDLKKSIATFISLLSSITLKHHHPHPKRVGHA